MPTLGEVASLLGSEVPSSAPPELELARADPIDMASAESLTFLTGNHPELLVATRAAVVIVAPDVAAAAPSSAPTLLVHENPRLAFIHVVERFFAPCRAHGIHPSAVVDASARIGADVAIGALATIGPGVVIGDRTVIDAGAHIYGATTIGEDVHIYAGAVVGGDGFGFERERDGSARRFPHIGTVVIEDGVEIGANACVDRGTLGATVIRRGAKIDNLVHIAHNVEIGEDAFVIALAMIGGSVRVGDRAWIAPSASLRDGIQVATDAAVGIGAVVVQDVPAGQTVAAPPARAIPRSPGIGMTWRPGGGAR